MAPEPIAATVHPHSTLLRRGVLLCAESVPERVVHVPESGICPVHNNGSCPMWFVPWADAERAGSFRRRLLTHLRFRQDAHGGVPWDEKPRWRDGYDECRRAVMEVLDGR